MLVILESLKVMKESLSGMSHVNEKKEKKIIQKTNKNNV